MKGVICGIDPGLSGAISLLYEDGTVYCYDMPTLTSIVGKKKKREVNTVELADILIEFPPDHVFLEKVASMPRQGVVSVFAFGRSFGAVEGVLGALKIPVTKIRPADWKREMKLSKDKGLSRIRATELYPNFAHLWKRVKDDGRAEALLLAHLGRSR